MNDHHNYPLHPKLSYAQKPLVIVLPSRPVVAHEPDDEPDPPRPLRHLRPMNRTSTSLEHLPFAA